MRSKAVSDPFGFAAPERLDVPFELKSLATSRTEDGLERRALDALCGGLDGALASLDDLNEAAEK